MRVQDLRFTILRSMAVVALLVVLLAFRDRAAQQAHRETEEAGRVQRVADGLVSTIDALENRVPLGVIPSVYVDSGHAWYFKEEYEKAIADFSEAIRIDPNYAEVYSLAGHGLAR